MKVLNIMVFHIDFDKVNTAINTQTETAKSTAETTANAATTNEQVEIAKIDTNRNGKVTIAEAKAAGYFMPIYSGSKKIAALAVAIAAAGAGMVAAPITGGVSMIAPAASATTIAITCSLTVPAIILASFLGVAMQ